MSCEVQLRSGRKTTLLAIAAILVWTGVPACSSGATVSTCGSVTSTAQPAGSGGPLVATGTFASPAGEQIQIFVTSTNELIALSTTLTATTATFSAIPPGTYTVYWVVSGCSAGGAKITGPATITVT